jgi:hypothetical protein
MFLVSSPTECNDVGGKIKNADVFTVMPTRVQAAAAIFAVMLFVHTKARAPIALLRALLRAAKKALSDEQSLCLPARFLLSGNSARVTWTQKSVADACVIPNSGQPLSRLMAASTVNPHHLNFIALSLRWATRRDTITQGNGEACGPR